MSQRVLAGRLGISASALSQFETGRSGLSQARLAQIARALDGSPQPATGAPPGRDWRRFDPLALDTVAAAAAAAFVEVGYHGATIRDIAERAGLSVPALYHYYRSKQQMLVTVLDVLMADLHWRMQDAGAAGGEPVERFYLLVECLALEHTHRCEIASIGHSELRSLEPANRARHVAVRTEIQGMVTAALQAGIAEGRFAAPHPAEAARAVVTLCTALVQWFRPSGPLSPEEVAARYVGIALDIARVR